MAPLNIMVVLLKSLLLTCLLLSPAYAVICKTVNSDGVVSYSDAPLSACENPIKLRELSRYRPSPKHTNKASISTNASNNKGYQSVNIVQPNNNATVRNNEGIIAISVTTQPALQKGHRLQLLLDGSAMANTFAGLGVTLTGIQRGTHTLAAQIVDAKGHVVKTSPPIRFTLRKASLFNKPKTQENADNQNNVDNNQAISHTPGQTNPDFSPTYR